MSQSDRLSASIDALGTAITNEIQQLKDAVAAAGVDNPAIEASITRLSDLTAQLTADDTTPPV